MDVVTKYMTRTEAAEILSCSTRTIDRLIARGEIPSLKVSPTQQGHRRISRDGFARFLAERLEGRRR